MGRERRKDGRKEKSISTEGGARKRQEVRRIQGKLSKSSSPQWPGRAKTAGLVAATPRGGPTAASQTFFGVAKVESQLRRWRSFRLQSKKLMAREIYKTKKQ